MNTSALVLSLALLGGLPLAASAAPATSQSIPGDSVYRLPLQMVNQDGQRFALASRRGKPQVLSMFYNSCEFVCPMLIDTIRLTSDQLSPAERGALDLMLVSFDPARDTPAVLKTVASNRQLDRQWTVATSDVAGVRKLAAALGIQYRKLSNGEFNHTTVLVLLDADGRIAARTQVLGEVDPAFLARLHDILKPPAP
ncbi:SCO family protein [Massilia sp. TS11]|uniref:SCO family protein n=1 Tax=Massilia sp. TS11 TaxID=2908003 RepID=UPI001EDB73BE|nr:SCO family protein [Massilia sp. TS11]MCG2583824.1 SCO family protein [Massilia sp. TS11]